MSNVWRICRMHNYGAKLDYFRNNQPAFNFPDFNRLANDFNDEGGVVVARRSIPHSSTT